MRHCVQVEALRYQYLNKPIQTTTEEDIPRRRKLLILGDYTAAKTHQMISLIESISSELNDFSTICKTSSGFFPRSFAVSTVVR